MLEVKDLSVYYGDMPGVRQATLAVPAGRIVAVIGANAAGKSTMLRAISGQVPIRSGTIELDGQRLDTLPAHRRVAAGVVQVPEGRRVFPYMSVLENLLMGAYTARARAEIPRTLDYVYSILPVLQERAREPAVSLSGGQQQMLAIGRGLMARPRLLMLDEPSLGLSPILVRQVFQVIKQIREQGVTVLLVEQTVRQSLALADYAYVLEHGRTTREGPAAELAADRAVQVAYMGV
jgi:ABC-type branched-subunit amino acid transport system ATPase component